MCTASKTINQTKKNLRTGRKFRKFRIIVVGLVTKSPPTLLRSHELKPAFRLLYGISPRKILEIPFPSPGDLPDPEMEPTSPAL